MKLQRFWMLLVASTFASGAWGRDITTTTGEVFHNAVVTKVQPDGIRITHDDGAGLIDFQILTEPDRKEFGFDPVAYAAAEKEEANFEKRQRDLRLLASQQALERAKKAADSAAAYAANAQPAFNRWPATMDVNAQTPDFSYNTYGGSGWVSWPLVPSTFFNSHGFGGRFRSMSGGGFGGGRSMSSGGGRR